MYGTSTNDGKKSVLINAQYHEGNNSFPFEIKKLDPKINAQLMKDFTGEHTGFIQVGANKWLLPSGFADELKNFYNFEFRKDDVVIVTFPRSGTTLTQEMIWLLCNDLDFKKALEIPLNKRYPYLEYSCLINKHLKEELLTKNSTNPDNYKLLQEIDAPVWKNLANMTNKRFIKTHLSFDLLPPNLTKTGCKIVYVARNPKDVIVSYYHLSKTMRVVGYIGDFQKYFDYFEKDLGCAPYWEHVKGGWNRKDEENVLFLFYEDIVKDLKSEIGKVAKFLNKSCTLKDMEKLENHLKFDNFKNNKSVNNERSKILGLAKKDTEDFIRKGKIGGWKDYFDEELENKANQWIKKNLDNTDLTFPL